MWECDYRIYLWLREIDWWELVLDMDKDWRVKTELSEINRSLFRVVELPYDVDLWFITVFYKDDVRWRVVWILLRKLLDK